MAAIIERLQDVGTATKAKGMDLLDRQIPPQQRSELTANLRRFASQNPKLAAFILTHLALTGGPLLVFTIFSLSVLVSSLVTCLLIGLFIALFFSAFCVGAALLVLLPTVFFSTVTANLLFSLGVTVYYILQRLNERRARLPPRDALGRRLNDLTGGRLELLAAPKEKREQALEVIRDDNPQPEHPLKPAKRSSEISGYGNDYASPRNVSSHSSNPNRKSSARDQLDRGMDAVGQPAPNVVLVDAIVPGIYEPAVEPPKRVILVDGITY